jgi:hypothetical protein
MPQTPGDDKDEPSLELPTLKLPGIGRRRRKGQPRTEQAASEPHRDAEQELTPEPARSIAERQAVTEPTSVATQTRPGSEQRRAGFEVPGVVAAGLTGLLVGAAGTGATVGAMAGCEVVRGVSTCGGGPGFFVLVAILALMILLGAGILSALRVSDSGSTSFLAVGVVTVVAMLVLLDVIFSPWMFLVIPLLGAAAYLMAFWVTTRFEGETSDTLRR